MSIFDRGNRGNVQNPFNGAGDAGTVTYSNARVPQNWNGNVALALNYIFDALYPNYKGTVATKSALPSNATVNDYYIVSDDGDGKSAGYVYSEIEGVTSWIKRYDVDYSAEGILAEAVTRTSYMYVSKFGSTDRDANGNPVTGKYAGQKIFGGDQAGQNLTLQANKIDKAGYLQTENSFVPMSPGLALGTLSDPFAYLILSDAAKINHLTISGNSLESDNQTVTIQSANLQLGQELQANGGALIANTLRLNTSVIEDDSGQIDFRNTNLSTNGQINASNLSIGQSATIANMQFEGNQISSGNNSISFGNGGVTNVGELDVNQVNASEVVVGSLHLTQDSLTTQSNSFVVSSSGNIEVQSPVKFDQTLEVSGNATVGGNFQSGAIKSGTSASLSTSNTDAVLQALTGSLKIQSQNQIVVNASLQPASDNASNLGAAASRFKTAFIAQSISDGTNAMPMATLQSFRNANVGATAGMSLFFDGTNWVPSIPDSEIDHRTLSGLTIGDSGHTQFALLAGRAGGQTLVGGSASGENLLLDSTSNATKGLVSTSSTFTPSNDQALDLGTSSKQWRHIFSSGIHYGLRLEAFPGSGNYPVNAAAKIGRLIFDTSTNQVAIDTGTAWAKVGNQKWQSDISADGTQTTYTVTVSSQISDARTAIWQLLDNTNGFEQVFAKMTKTLSAVTITTNVALPAGSYRLIGLN